MDFNISKVEYSQLFADTFDYIETLLDQITKKYGIDRSFNFLIKGGASIYNMVDKMNKYYLKNEFIKFENILTSDWDVSVVTKKADLYLEKNKLIYDGAKKYIEKYINDSIVYLKSALDKNIPEHLSKIFPRSEISRKIFGYSDKLLLSALVYFTNSGKYDSLIDISMPTIYPDKSSIFYSTVLITYNDFNNFIKNIYQYHKTQTILSTGLGFEMISSFIGMNYYEKNKNENPSASYKINNYKNKIIEIIKLLNLSYRYYRNSIPIISNRLESKTLTGGSNYYKLYNLYKHKYLELKKNK